MTELTNDQIWDLRFNAAIERFCSFDEYMEIPGYGVEPECPPTPILMDFQEQKRYEACKQRYQGMEEYMEIPDMDFWLKLKNEILGKKRPPKYALIYPMNEREEIENIYNDNDEDDYSDYNSVDYCYDKEEFRYKCFKDKYV